MSGVRWDIMQPIDYAGNVRRAFDHGRELRRQMETEKALNALSGNPQDTDALRRLYANAPELGMRFEDQLHQRAERGRADEFRNATAEMLLGGQGQQPGVNMPAPPLTDSVANPMDAGRPAGPAGGPAPSVASGIAAPASFAPQALAPGMSAPSPMAPGNDAYARAVRANPFEALRVQNQKMELTKSQFNILQGLNAASLQLLGGVNDQASYDAAKQRAQAMYGQFGLDLSAMHLPEQYSPEAIDGLMRSAMKTREQFSVMASENRLDWDMVDDQEDNERADRNQQSLAAHRSGQLANTRRGQDITDRRGRRGQDMTDKRVRDSAGFKGTGGKGKAAAPAIVDVKTIEEARRLPPGTMFRTPDKRIKVR